MKKLKFSTFPLFYNYTPLVLVCSGVNLIVDHGSWVLYWLSVAQIFCLLMVAICDLMLAHYKELEQKILAENSVE